VKNLELTQEDRARIADSKHKLQSVTNSLDHIDPGQIPQLDEIQDCLESADKTLKGVLSGEAKKKV
jgi:hypothetical protein